MKIALKREGYYVCAENGGDNAGIVHVNRREIGSWETWTVQRVGFDQIALHTVNGRYLCAEDGGGGEVHANRLAIGEWETFPADALTTGIFRTISGRHYLNVRSDANRTLEARATSPTVFEVEVLENGPGLLSRVRVDGRKFRDAENRVWFLKGVSLFMAYWRFLNGEDIRPLLGQMRDLGSNCIRIFGMAYFVPVNEFGAAPFKPQTYGDRYYSQLPAFCGLAAQFGQYLYWCVFTDVRGEPNLMPNESDQRRHFDRVVDALRRTPNTLLELNNEQNAHDFNQVNKAAFPRPSGLASCSGSYGDIGEAIPGPHWDFVDFHPPRRYPTHIKDCCVVDHPNYVQGMPVLLGEPDRFGSNGNPNEEQAALSAGTAAGSALGYVFHSRRGTRAELFDEETLRCARANFDAFKAK
jgi:hypothetical protein